MKGETTVDTLTAILALLVTLSMATERVTEAIKGFPYLSRFLASNDLTGDREELRKATIQVIAIVIGTIFASLVSPQIAHMLSPSKDIGVRWPVCLLFGAMASGGSGIWNTALDTVRQISKQKELVTKKMTG